MAVDTTISFITLVEAKAYLGITVATYDDLLESIINGVAAAMETSCKRKLKARDYSYLVGDEEAILNGNNLTTLYVPEYPVNSITTFRVDETAYTTTNDDYSDSTGFKWWKNGKLFFETVFSAYMRNVQLVYNAGYADGSAEYLDLKTIQLKLTSYDWERRGHETYKSEKIGNYSYALVDGGIYNTPMMMDLKLKYRREAFA